MRRVWGFAPAWMWLFWLVSAVVIAAGFWRDGEPEPRFLVAKGPSLEVWHGAGRESTLITYDDGSSITDVALSPDGTMIAFIRLLPVTRDLTGKDDYGSDLYVARADGSQPRPVVRHSVISEIIDSPVWLASGEEVAYAIVSPYPETGMADQRIEAVDVRSGRRRRLVDNGVWPALMPGGRELIFSSIGADGSETPTLVDVATSAISALPSYKERLVFVNSFQASPSGRLIAFAAATPSENPFAVSRRGLRAAVTHPIQQDIWLMAPDGSELRMIADLALATPSIAWSDDERWVYVMSTRGLVRVSVASGRQEQLRSDFLGRMRLLPAK